MSNGSNIMRRAIRNIVESLAMREADLSDGSKAEYGSPAHVKELEARIRDLEAWRSRQRRGSEQRANYSRLVAQLRKELKSAVNYAERKVRDTLARIENVKEDELHESQAVIHYQPIRNHGSLCGKAKGSMSSAKADVTCSLCKRKFGHEQDLFNDE